VNRISIRTANEEVYGELINIYWGKGWEVVEWIDSKKFIKIFFWDAAKGKEAVEKIFHGIFESREENKLKQKLSRECSWFMREILRSFWVNF
jgi:hypothetical protein